MLCKMLVCKQNVKAMLLQCYRNATASYRNAAAMLLQWLILVSKILVICLAFSFTIGQRYNAIAMLLGNTSTLLKSTKHLDTNV